MRVAVFCASANEVEPCYFREAGRGLLDETEAR